MCFTQGNFKPCWQQNRKSEDGPHLVIGIFRNKERINHLSNETKHKHSIVFIVHH